MPDNARRAIDRLISSTTGPLIAAVSGGSDSLALLHLAHERLEAAAARERLVAVTVDHGLRAASAVEAETVGAICSRLGVPHHILNWTGTKPSQGIQAAARDARQRLLAKFATEAGGAFILTGHTLDDRLETHFMRKGRSDAGRGLASIAPATLHERAVWFVRPLAHSGREGLRHQLRNRHVVWVDDPSNEDTRYERVRVRRALAGKPACERDDMIAAMDLAGRERTARAERVAKLLADQVATPVITQDRATVLLCGHRHGRADETHVLAWLTGMIGRRAHLPGGEGFEKLKAFSETSTNGSALTLGGCLLRRRGDLVEIEREGRNAGSGTFGPDRLLPSFDIAVARALDARLGRPEIPAVPEIFPVDAPSH